MGSDCQFLIIAYLFTLNVNNPKAREEVLNIMIEANLVDVWRELHLEKNSNLNGGEKSRSKGKIRFFFFNFRAFIYKC